MAAIIGQIKSGRKMHELRHAIEERNVLISLSDDNHLKAHEADPESGHIRNTDATFAERLETVMKKHIADENFNVGVMTKELGMSRTGLFTKMKDIYGVSPQTWITDYRLNTAMELLKTRRHTVSEISEMVGFATITGFSRSFKNKFGTSPSSITKSMENTDR